MVYIRLIVGLCTPSTLTPKKLAEKSKEFTPKRPKGPDLRDLELIRVVIRFYTCAPHALTLPTDLSPNFSESDPATQNGRRPYKRMPAVQKDASHIKACQPYKRMSAIQKHASRTKGCLPYKSMLAVQKDASHTKVCLPYKRMPAVQKAASLTKAC